MKFRIEIERKKEVWKWKKEEIKQAKEFSYIRYNKKIKRTINTFKKG